MAYYLTIKKKDTYIPINIECLDCFTKLSKIKVVVIVWKKLIDVLWTILMNISLRRTYIRLD